MGIPLPDFQFFQRLQRRAAGEIFVVGHVFRRVEKAEQAVADELVDGPGMPA